jgi:hypothetical protein
VKEVLRERRITGVNVVGQIGGVTVAV